MGGGAARACRAGLRGGGAQRAWGARRVGRGEGRGGGEGSVGAGGLARRASDSAALARGSGGGMGTGAISQSWSSCAAKLRTAAFSKSVYLFDSASSEAWCTREASNASVLDATKRASSSSGPSSTSSAPSYARAANGFGSTGATDFDGIQVIRGTVGGVAHRGEPTFERFLSTPKESLTGSETVIVAGDFEGVWFAGDRSSSGWSGFLVEVVVLGAAVVLILARARFGCLLTRYKRSVSTPAGPWGPIPLQNDLSALGRINTPTVPKIRLVVLVQAHPSRLTPGA